MRPHRCGDVVGLASVEDVGRQLRGSEHFQDDAGLSVPGGANNVGYTPRRRDLRGEVADAALEVVVFLEGVRESWEASPLVEGEQPFVEPEETRDQRREPLQLMREGFGVDHDELVGAGL